MAKQEEAEGQNRAGLIDGATSTDTQPAAVQIEQPYWISQLAEEGKLLSDTLTLTERDANGKWGEEGVASNFYCSFK
jgi:hypothetical protein